MANTQNLLDIDFALSQLGGNTDLLSRMLNRFEEEFADVPSAVKAFLASDDIKQAKMKVHTTKGLSGNLGLMPLFECSKELDQQLREGIIDQSKIDEFDQLMKDTCAFIGGIDLLRKAPVEFSPDDKSNSFAQEFITKLQRHEFIDDTTLHQYVNSLNVNEGEKQHLVALIEELRYDEAIKIIQGIS